METNSGSQFSSSTEESDKNSEIVSECDDKNAQNIAVGRKVSIKSSFNNKTNNIIDALSHLIISQEKDLLRVNSSERDLSAIERSNLVNLMKLVIKELLETTISNDRTIDSHNIPLQHFFILIEHVFRHGLKSKKGLLGLKRDIWNVFEVIERLSPEASDITSSARELPSVRTIIGRSRAWIRLALMKKKLADYFSLLIDKRDVYLKDYYEENALMMSDEAIVVGGLLVGLNTLDCNLCIKEEDLDNQSSVIDFSNYLRDNIQKNQFINVSETNNCDHELSNDTNNLIAVLDQKNYVEELNRHLSSTVSNLEHKIELLQTDKILLSEELELLRKSLLNNGEKADHIDYTSEEALMHEILNPNNELSLIKEQLNDEIKSKKKIEKELEITTYLKNESETAANLLERDVLEKQDTIITLRRQIDDLKAINLQTCNKLQECELTIKNKTDRISHMEQKVTVLTNRVCQLEENLVTFEKRRINVEENNQKLNDQLNEKEQKRLLSERDLKQESEWRNSLKILVDEQQEQITALQNEMEHLKSAASESQKLKRDNLQLEKKCAEYELSLFEIGSQLQDSKLEVDNLKENSGRLREAVWTDDKGANNCSQCSIQFSVARRKHHCRNCGKIYCGNCSNNEMLLPSNKKPVRVCDSCHTFLLERYSAT